MVHTDSGVTDVKMNRHTHNVQQQAYGNSAVKRGAGKYNWGAAGEEGEAAPLDTHDPMYDSDNEDNKNSREENKNKQSNKTIQEETKVQIYQRGKDETKQKCTN